MSRAGLVYYVSGRIEIFHDSELAALNCSYVRAYDEAGVYVQAAVRSGLAYATKHNVQNWIVDVSDQVDSMSAVDQKWENSEDFLQLFRDSSIRNILLVTAAPASGEGRNSAAVWAKEFETELGDDFRVGVATNRHETRTFFLR
ncbi:MAG: hypothetical protein OEZ19_01025 [Paracoccaceae bacterium]|nr:hypothetical protein [Paracoccaceae bacterium]